MTFFDKILAKQGFININMDCAALIDQEIVIPSFQKYNLQATEKVKFKNKQKTKLYNLLKNNTCDRSTT